MGYDIIINRVFWYAFIPKRVENGAIGQFSWEWDLWKQIGARFVYGYTYLIHTNSNRFYFTCNLIQEGDRPYQTVKSFEFYYDFTLSNCPAESFFEVDWEAGTVTRTR